MKEKEPIIIEQACKVVEEYITGNIKHGVAVVELVTQGELEIPWKNFVAVLKELNSNIKFAAGDQSKPKNKELYNEYRYRLFITEGDGQNGKFILTQGKEVDVR